MSKSFCNGFKNLKLLYLMHSTTRGHLHELLICCEKAKKQYLLLQKVVFYQVWVNLFCQAKKYSRNLVPGFRKFLQLLSNRFLVESNLDLVIDVVNISYQLLGVLPEKKPDVLLAT